MKLFVDRNEEMNTLEQEFQRKESAMVILYGRRRVGKTTLISEFIQDKNALYYLVTEEQETQNRNNFKNMVADFIGSSLLKNASVENWDILFQELVSFPSSEKKVIVIDEFQYLGKSNAAFPSIFQKIWDTILKDAGVQNV